MGEVEGLPVGDVSSQAPSTFPCSLSPRAVLLQWGLRGGGGAAALLERVEVSFWDGLNPGRRLSVSVCVYICDHVPGYTGTCLSR